MMVQPRKRFWKEVVVQEQETGKNVLLLDNRPVKLPKGEMLSVSSKALIEAIALEWSAIGEGDSFTPDQLSLTRIAGTMIERIAPNVVASRKALLAYGLDDAMCYQSPAQDKILLQCVLEWAAHKDLKPSITNDIMPLEQSESYKRALISVLESMTEAQLAALGVMTPVLSSLLLPLALLHGVITIEEALRLGNADEEEQLRKWGYDKEMACLLERREKDIRDAMRFMELSL